MSETGYNGDKRRECACTCDAIYIWLHVCVCKCVLASVCVRVCAGAQVRVRVRRCMSEMLKLANSTQVLRTLSPFEKVVGNVIFFQELVCIGIGYAHEF